MVMKSEKEERKEEKVKEGERKEHKGKGKW